MARYEVWLANSAGERRVLLESLESMACIIAPGRVGACTILTPGLTPDDVGRDYQLHIFRAPDDDTPLSLLRVYLLRHAAFTTDALGIVRATLTGRCQNDLLNRRIIAYAAGSAQAEKTDLADDMIKALVDENLGSSATDTDRDITALGFSIEADASGGASITMGYAWQGLLETLQKIQATTAAQGDEVFFDITVGSVDQYGTPAFILRTFIGQPGTDRRRGVTGAGLVFSPELGNLAVPYLALDWSDEVTYVYAGGRGQGSDRVIKEVSDDDAIGASRYGRIEDFAFAVENDDPAGSPNTGVEEKAYARLQQRQARTLFEAQLVDAAGSRFGIDWFVGDRVTAEAYGQSFDEVIRMVEIQLDDRGRETVIGRFDYGVPMSNIAGRLVARSVEQDSRIKALETASTDGGSKYRLTQSGSDLTTTNLPHHGDYGFRTDTSQLQVNVSGTIRKISYT